MKIHIICHNITTIASALPSLFWSGLKGKQCSSWRWVYWFSGCLTPPSTSTKALPISGNELQQFLPAQSSNLLGDL